MRYRTLGKTGLEVSLLGFGTGGQGRMGQTRGLTLTEQDALVRRCLDLGINLFDTSERYADSEENLGRALAGVPRHSYHLITKWHQGDGVSGHKGPEELISSVEKSLRLLRTDYIDVMMFHGLTEKNHDVIVKALYPTMKWLQGRGKVRYIGFSELFVTDPEHRGPVVALKANPELWDVIMLKYGILNQAAARQALPLALAHNVGIINMAVIRVKLPDPDRLRVLMEEWRSQGVFPAASMSEHDPLGWLVHDGVDSVISAGYKFAADHTAVASVLTGTSSIAHLEANAAALDKPSLPEADNERLIRLFSRVAEYA